MGKQEEVRVVVPVIELTEVFGASPLENINVTGGASAAHWDELSPSERRLFFSSLRPLRDSWSRGTSSVLERDVLAT